jgi:hypothetical protein
MLDPSLYRSIKSHVPDISSKSTRVFGKSTIGLLVLRLWKGHNVSRRVKLRLYSFASALWALISSQLDFVLIEWKGSRGFGTFRRTGECFFESTKRILTSSVVLIGGSSTRVVCFAAAVKRLLYVGIGLRSCFNHRGECPFNGL